MLQIRSPGNGSARLHNGLQTAGLLSNFGAAKLAIYLVPLALAAAAPASVYGGIEFAYATALLAVTAIVGAPLHGLSHKYLVGEEKEIQDQADALVLICILAALAGFAVAALLGAPAHILLVFALAGLSSVQVIQSFLLRVYCKPVLLAWADGLVPLAGLLIVVVTDLVTGEAMMSTTIGGFLALALAIFAAASIQLARGKADHLRQRLLASARAGAAMAVYALFGTWIAVSGRILIGFIAAQDLSAYAVAFRIAGIAFGVSQLGSTWMWSRIYTADTDQADRLIARWLAGTALVCALVTLIGGPLIQGIRFDALDSRTSALAAAIMPVLSIHIYFWSAHTLMQPRVNRLGMATRSLGTLSITSAATVAVVLGAHRLGLGTIAVVWLLAVSSVFYFFGVWAVLARRGAAHRQAGLTALVGGLFLVLLACC